MEDTIRVALCVDDTDDVTKETSTGAVAERIAGCIAAMGGELELAVTRHQLLLDERVPYTSHNSSMAMTAQVPSGSFDELRRAARETVRSMCAAASDPGLCIACVPDDEFDPLLHELIAYGLSAKSVYLEKASAYELAERAPWLHLEELGGTGQGVVGALAGVGLRLSGCDGRFRGKWDLKALCEGGGPARANRHGKNRAGAGHGKGHGRKEAGKHEAASAALPVFPAARVEDALEQGMRGRAFVVDLDGNRLAGDTPVLAAPRAKPLLYAGRMTIVTQMGEDGVAVPCSKDELDAAHGAFCDTNRSCSAFEYDNDLEEFGRDDSSATCPNCLYRRWTNYGFTCMRRNAPACSFSEATAI